MCDGEKVRHAWIYGGMCEIRPPVYSAEHRDPGDRNSESKELRMVADGSLLGPSVAEGRGACAVGGGQEACH